MRDRAYDLLAEEDDLARTLAATWARDPDRRSPASTPTPTRCWRTKRSGRSTRRPIARRADRPGIGMGPGRRRRRRADRSAARAARTGLGSSSPPTAPARRPPRELLRDPGSTSRSVGTGGERGAQPGGSSSSRRSTAAASSAREGGDRRRADLTGRRRAHRRPAAQAAERELFEDLKPGNYVVHYQHGVGNYEGMVKRTIGGIERDYLLPVQGRRQALRAERPDRHAAPVRRWRVADAAPPRWCRLRQGQGPRQGAVREIAQELVVLYQKRVNAEGHAVRPGHAVAVAAGGGVPVRRDARPAQGDRRRQGRHGAAVPDGPPALRRRRLRQDRGRDPRRVQGDPGRQAGRRARPDHAARHAARQHVRRPVRRLPDPRRGAQPLPHQKEAKKVIDGLKTGEVDCVIGTHRLLATTSSSRTSVCWSSTRSSASACSTKRR